MDLWSTFIRQTKFTKRFTLLVIVLCMLIVFIYSTVPVSDSKGDKTSTYDGDKERRTQDDIKDNKVIHHELKDESRKVHRRRSRITAMETPYDGDNDVVMPSDSREKHENSHGERDDYYGEEDIDALTMKRDEKDVPIVIVDQHQEVIPYWYKAVKEKIIASKDNTLIHIDAHSDMAPPADANSILSFITKNRHQPSISHLPLMQANDRFIISAVMTGLINRVIWIKPDWTDPKNETSVFFGYVGTTKNRQRETGCACIRHARKLSAKNRKPTIEYTCHYSGEDSDNITMVKMPKKACRKVKFFRWFVVSESRFKTLFNTKTLKQGQIFVDIDEDYFGVESGVQAVMNAGIALDNILVVNDFLTNHYCPNSFKSENDLNRQLKLLFKKLSSMKSPDEIEIEKEIITHTSHFFCSRGSQENELDLVASFLQGLSSDLLGILSTLTYCNSNSQRLTKQGKQSFAEESFIICHGALFPDDNLNQLFVDTKIGIDSRANNLKSLLEHVFRSAKPGFFTIARSLRDGYTPRKQQAYIEKKVINVIRELLETSNLTDHLIYDKYLLMGKDVWTA